MHDIRLIREDPDEFDRGLEKLGIPAQSKHVLAMDAARRAATAKAESLRAERKSLSRAAGAEKAKGNNDEFTKLRNLVAEARERLTSFEREVNAADESLHGLLSQLPNLPYSDVPFGKSEADNLEVRQCGDLPEFDFEPAEHFNISAVRGDMDFETAAKISGSRFVVLTGPVARLHRALAQFMLDTLVQDHGLTEVWTPVIVRDEMMFGTGQLPKFGDDSYRLANQKWLIPTAEVTLTNMIHGMIVDESHLPRRYCAHTQCFRSEAGAAGKDTAGMLRQHQFEKVEMVSITHPENSEIEQTRMRRCAESILEKLNLPYRTVVLCTGDMGFSARRTFDIEVWLPGQNKFREISSVSTCGDFQARRMNARFRPADGSSPRFVHTLNGSGLAVGRALIAVLENGQRDDGSVVIPRSLRPYLANRAVLNADGSFS